VISANNNFNLSSAMLAYSDSLRAKAAAAAAKTEDSDSTTATPSKSATTDNTTGTGTSATDPAKGSTATEQVVAASPSTSYKTTRGRQELDKTQQDLAKSLRDAVTKMGGSLKGEVAFSLDSAAGLKITGSDADKATISAALKADKSSPSLASRLASLTKNAVELESTNRSHAAISQAARHAKTSAGVMSLYTTLMQQQQGTSTTAVFAVSDKNSSLTYKGMVNTSA
jgi:hypothetical protein